MFKKYGVVIVVMLTTVWLLLEIGNSLERKNKKCAPVKRINLTHHKWNKYDRKILRGEQISCGFRKGGGACVISFTKTGDRRYETVCGDKR